MSNRFCNMSSDRRTNIFSNSVRVRRNQPKGGADIFLRLLSLDPNKGKKLAGFLLCSEASRSFHGVGL